MNSTHKSGWLSVKWLRSTIRVKRLQRRIFKASLRGDRFRMRFLQNRLVNSFDAKLLAVKRVTSENKGKRTPGLDLNMAKTPEDKWNLVCKLKIDGKAAPIRRVFVPKSGKRGMRPLGIPIILDRAKQKLLLMALEPEWEAHFEPNSYGFRPGRSCQDAVEAIFISLHGRRAKNTPLPSSKFILDADIKGCFDNIDHDYLINKVTKIPSFQKQIKAWLKAGIFEGFFLNPNTYCSIPENQLGTPQGGIISPFLANVALHGLENHLKQWILSQSWPIPAGQKSSSQKKRQSLAVIRYADDFVVMHKSRNVILAAKQEISSWLVSTSKLVLSDSKTYIKSSYEGFQFLGFSFITVRRRGIDRIKCYPTRAAQKNLSQNVSDTCKSLKAASAYDLIRALRPKILVWANYYITSECSRVFVRL
jgi:RNA-directed DNA polymerase